MKNIFKNVISFSLLLLLMSSCNDTPAEQVETKKELCQFKGCNKEVTGWDNYRTDGSYHGPMYQGSFHLKTYGGSFCSQEHAIKALD
jgi:hypothetical protein